MKRGDVVLVHLPFVGTVGSKVRPALVLQNDVLNKSLRETIIAEITSNLKHVTRPHQVLIDLSTTDGAASNLLMDSAVRCERVHVISQSDVRQVIGVLSASLMQQVEAAVKSALGIP